MNLDDNIPLSMELFLGTNRASSTRETVTRIHQEMGDTVYRHLVALGLPPETAEDVCQECFVRLFLALEGRQQIERPRAWLFKVAYNLALNQFKVSHREQRHFVPWIDNLPDEEHDLQPNPEQASLDRERHLRLRQALEMLSPQQRQCLFLRCEGLRYREIAEVLGISVGTVSEFLRRAINHLQRSGI